MMEWSEADLMVRDAVRSFIDKEIRPHTDALESGELAPPYPIIRKLFAQFGLDALAAEQVQKMLARERARGEGEPQPRIGVSPVAQTWQNRCRWWPSWSPS